MRIEQQNAPETTPILLDEIKEHLRIDGAEEDANLGALGAAAVAVIETHLDMALVNRPVVIYLDSWPAAGSRSVDVPWWSGVAEGAITELEQVAYHAPLPVKPVQSVEAVEIITAGGSTVAWGVENYYLKPGINPALVRQYGRAWPVSGAVAEGIRISVTAGFGANWNHVPASIRQALLMLVTHMYYNKGDAPTGIATGNPLKASGASNFLTAYRDMRL